MSLIFSLLGIAVLLTAATVWYWRITRPDDDLDDGPDDGPDLDDLKSDQAPAAAVVTDLGGGSLVELDAESIDVSSEADREPVPVSAAVAQAAPSPPEMPAVESTPSPEAPATSSEEAIGADGELVSETSERGREFSDDGWDAIRRSVIDRFQG